MTYKEMQAGDLLHSLGDDAQKWADAFMEITQQGPGVVDTRMDRDIMVAWFANAIESGADFKHGRRLQMSEPDWQDFLEACELDRAFRRSLGMLPAMDHINEIDGVIIQYGDNPPAGITDLAFSLFLRCDRIHGWELFSLVGGDQTLIAAQCLDGLSKAVGLKVTVDGKVICDSLTPVKDIPPHAQKQDGIGQGGRDGGVERALPAAFSPHLRAGLGEKLPAEFLTIPWLYDDELEVMLKVAAGTRQMPKDDTRFEPTGFGNEYVVRMATTQAGRCALMAQKKLLVLDSSSDGAHCYRFTDLGRAALKHRELANETVVGNRLTDAAMEELADEERSNMRTTVSIGGADGGSDG